MKLEIRKSKISGLGLFTLEDISWGERIIEYSGEKISKKEGNRRKKFYEGIGVSYLFNLNEKYDIDGLVGGNESRFINHSKNFNCVVIKDKDRIFFHAYDYIKNGEELTFDYGDSFNFK